MALALTFGASGCGGWWRSAPPRAAQGGATSPAEARAKLNETDVIIRELEARVAQDPQDFVAFNKLAGYYLQRQRETGEDKYIDLAERAARASLAILPAEQNAGGLSALAQVEIASHNFAAARDYGLQLTRMQPQKASPYQILGDALMELGEYERAEEAFKRVREVGGISVGGEARLARLALLRGKPEEARQYLARALSVALEQVPRPLETVAWCRWQLGDVMFSTGDYENAERYYREALAEFPDYTRALAALARVRAARGDLAGAVEHAEHVVRLLPDPAFLALLGDLYKLAGRDEDAARQYELVEKTSREEAAEGKLHARELALFYADHDMNVEEAFNLASRDYEKRPDIYAADALAWTAFKAGKLPEAQEAIKKALRLGTQDAKLFYHAGMIARAAGDQAAANDYLKRALKINPHFDPLQSSIAHREVGDLGD